MKFFSIESPLYKFFVWLWEMVKLSVLWVVFSLPIFTVGSATVALCYVTNQMVEDLEGRTAHTFVKEFKRNFKKGVPLGLLALVCLYAVYLDFQFYRAVEGNPVSFLVIGILAGVIFFMSFIYAFHLMARYENTIWHTIKNSYNIATKYFGRTILLCILLLAEMIFWFWTPTTILIGLFVAAGVVAYTISAFAMRVFHEIEKANQS